MPKKCYLCDHAFDEQLTRQHREHIIQNAIGGALVSRDILCEVCGGELGNSVDTPFLAALSPLTILLNPPRDRGDHSRTETRLLANSVDTSSLEKIQFNLNSDFSVVPLRPLYFRNDSLRTVTVIGATRTQAEEYANSPQVKVALLDGYALELSTNAAAYARSLILPVSPNSLEVLRGVLKIAIEYASYSGVPREIFEHFLEKGDLTNCEVLLQSSIFPYYPTTDAERLFETEKHTHEDWYPTHHLYLFSQGQNLYCYVDLFGTIQKYVHINNKYNGPPIVNKFVQKAEKWDFDEERFTAKRLKDLHIFAGQFGVEMKGRSFAEIQKDILHQARSRAYSLDPDDTIEKVSTLVRLLIEFCFLENGEKVEPVRKVFEKANSAKVQLGLSLLDDIKANKMIAWQRFHQDFSDFRIGNVEASCPEQAQSVPAADLEKYAAYKFYDLLRAKGWEAMLQYNFV